MFSAVAHKNLADAESYFDEHLAQNDYYAAGEIRPGQWIGAGAERLGLRNNVTREQFHALCENQNPNDGERLTQRQQKENKRRVFFDFTCAPPKSVVPEHELLTTALAHRQGEVDLGNLKQEVKYSAELVKTERGFSTKEIFTTELALIQTVNAGCDSVAPLHPGYRPADWLGEDQRRAIYHVLRTSDRITGLHGLAGSGKTTALRELVAACEEAKIEALFCAPTAAATEVLRKEGFEAKTLQSLLLSKQPVHINGKVVHPAQIDVDGNFATLQNVQKVFGLRLNQQPLAQRLEMFRLRHDLPANLVFAGLGLDDFVQDLLPCSRGHEPVAVAEINAGQAQVHGRLVAGFVHGSEQTGSLVRVGGLEAGSLAGGFVHAIELTAPAAAVD
jgi:hypothetical protein